MAVEKMLMLNIVGKLDYMEEMLYEILHSGSLDMVDAMAQLNQANAIYDVESRDVDMMVDVSRLIPYEVNPVERERLAHTRQLMQYFGLTEEELEGLEDSLATREDLDALYEETKVYFEEEEEIKEQLALAHSFKENVSLFYNVDIDLNALKDMEFFTARFGRLEKAARLRLKENYHHILAMVFHTGSYENEEVYLAIYPNEVSEEAERVLQSLHWIDVPILEHAEGTTKETFEYFNRETEQLNQRLEELDEHKHEMFNERSEEIQKILAKALFYGRIEEAKEQMAHSKKYFLLSGWTDEEGVEEVRNRVKKYEGTHLTVLDEGNGNFISTPPTKLKNPSFFKPFELLVRMYGVPHYNEIDPTIFVGITYMILFGAMFGDVGQGLIFLLGGLLIRRKPNLKDMGGLLTRMGGASIVFGFLYGSLFGNEEILPALWIRPFHNINEVLIIAIGFGMLLLFMAYGLSFANAIRNKNLYEGIFGEHGLLGFLVFLMLIFMLLDLTGFLTLIPAKVAGAILVLSIVLMIFKKPIMAKIQNKAPHYAEGKTGYYIESSFSIIELLISTLSGIVSFIRVGAFAINHVGLFMAFHTMAEMAGTGIGNFIILILGNILIIGLEGLIVFIQGLRLEYYELFSRYYDGSGTAFNSDTLSLKNKK
ncbi:ATPase [Peptoniphilus sp. KCTC 25270]|uniref:V-type ATP synthase subunit I n=1 Tax=Peptoniphilus sp. KCTC 25270 TaxID=2897414 RepID=UPI001E595072|nr:V-type ATPase 116kDa subunit family protein [Peptoniphilus sp. KCTC 25270]MCD1147794.1 ATPase [Peptoniphilus sp. KCTC 25270]